MKFLKSLFYLLPLVLMWAVGIYSLDGAALTDTQAALQAVTRFGALAQTAVLRTSGVSALTRCIVVQRNGALVKLGCVAGSWEALFASLPQANPTGSLPTPLKFSGHFGCITNPTPAAVHVSTPFGPTEAPGSILLDCEDRLYSVVTETRKINPTLADTILSNHGIWLVP